MTTQRRITLTAQIGLPAAIILFVLWAGYAAATHRRYGDINGVPGELLAGESFGQTFASRYSGLSGIEVQLGTYERMADPNRSTLVFRLRESPGAVQDIATATLPPTLALEQNPWYSFTFPAIAGSAGKSYYLLVETPDGAPGRSMTLFWYQPPTRGDPYAEGAAYRNGQPTKGDFAFGLQYDAPPLQVWTAMIDRAGRSTSAWLVWVLLLGGVAVMSLGAIRLMRGTEPGTTAPASETKPWRSILLPLGVGLASGLLFLFLVPPWQGPDEYTHFAYAALLDKHDLDNGKVEALDLADKDRDFALIQAVNASADRHDFTRRVGGNSGPGAPTRTDPFIFQQIRQPPAYYWLGAVALRVARIMGIPADPYTNPEAALYTMRFVSLLLGLWVLAIAWLALGWRIATVVALLPMHTFIAAVVNNDIVAEVAVSALFLALLTLLRTAFQSSRWPTRRGWLLAGICILITLLGVGTKATAPAAALPLLAGGLAVWLGVGVARKYPELGSRIPKIVRTLAAVAAAFVLLLVGFFLLVEPRADSSVGWFRSYVPLQSAERIPSATAHDGTHVIRIEAEEGSYAVQRLVPPLIVHPPLRVTLAGWLRVQSPAADDPPISAELVIMDGNREAGATSARLEQERWTRIEVQGDVQANAEGVELRVRVGPGTRDNTYVEFDDLSLSVEVPGAGGSTAWNNPVYTAALIDPSGEQARWALRPLFEGLLPEEASTITSAILNPQPFSKPALWSEYGTAQYKSFWGSFGWLTLELPSIAYWSIALLTLLALSGLLVRTVTGAWGWQAWLAAISLLSLLVAIGISCAKQMALTAYGGLPSVPQGRYLFVLIIPAVWLLWAGLSALTVRLGTQAHAVARLLLASGLLLLTLYCLLALVFPYYYG